MKIRLLSEDKLFGLVAFLFLISAMLLVSCGGGGGGSTPVDNDNDGYNSSVDCNDNDPAINPGVNEICGNGIDEDCSGADLICPGGTGTINQDNIGEITQGINAFVSLGDNFDLMITDPFCEVGDATTTGSISDPPAVNDTVTVTYNNCQEFGVITNGTTTMTITEVSGDINGNPPHSLTIHLMYNDLSSEDVNLGLVSTSSADMYISISEDGMGNFSSVYQGNLLTQKWDDEVVTLSDFLMELTYNMNTGDHRLNMFGDLDSTLIGGPVSFNTTTPFTGNEFIGNGDPTAGVLHVTTSIDNSQALITALPDGVNLQIMVDSDGDGNYEYVDLIPWSNL